jgi:ribosome-associated protein
LAEVYFDILQYQKLSDCYTYNMIEISPSIQIDEQELEFTFVHSNGPGGQNVNKVSSAVQLRFNIRETPSLPVEVKQRLVKLAGRRMTSDEILIIEARQYRSQEKNRKAAQERLIRLIQQAVEPPKPRLKTKPTYASNTRRLESKRKRGEIKRMRRDSEIVG